MAPNFMFLTGGGGTEDFAIVPATISAMFIQSYQKNIHLFPDWPMDQDVSFGNLNACGGFLISCELKQGQLNYVKIQSNAGQECHLVNPWPHHAVRITSDRKTAVIVTGETFTFQTQQSENFVLTAQP
jgi:alpha-L-fucosidase 2